MREKIKAAKSYVTSASGKELIVGIAIVVSFIAIIIAIIVYIAGSGPKIDYQPSVACNLLTKEEASEMLGAEIIHHAPKKPTLSGNVVTSKCSYTDANPQKGAMLVAAIAVRSAVTDKGIERNKTEFAAARSGKNLEIVKDLGESAYFSHERGQLNILSGRNWIILSFGPGETPQTKTLAGARELAQKVLFAPELPSF